MDGPQRLIDACKNSSPDMATYYYFPETSEKIHLTNNAMSIFGMDCDFVSEGKNNQSSTNGDIYEFTATFKAHNSDRIGNGQKAGAIEEKVELTDKPESHIYYQGNSSKAQAWKSLTTSAPDIREKKNFTLLVNRLEI